MPLSICFVSLYNRAAAGLITGGKLYRGFVCKSMKNFGFSLLFAEIVIENIRKSIC